MYPAGFFYQRLWCAKHKRRELPWILVHCITILKIFCTPYPRSPPAQYDHLQHSPFHATTEHTIVHRYHYSQTAVSRYCRARTTEIHFRCSPVQLPTCMPSRCHHKLRCICHKHPIIVFAQSREQRLLHAELQEHQCMEIKLLFKWTGLGPCLSQHRFLSARDPIFCTLLAPFTYQKESLLSMNTW